MSTCSNIPTVLAEKCYHGVQVYEHYRWFGVVLLLAGGAIAIRIAIEKRRSNAINFTLKDQKLGVKGAGDSYIFPNWRIRRKWLVGPVTALVIKLPAGKTKEQINAAAEALAACLGGGVSFTEPDIKDRKVIFTIRKFE